MCSEYFALELQNIENYAKEENWPKVEAVWDTLMRDFELLYKQAIEVKEQFPATKDKYAGTNDESPDKRERVLISCKSDPNLQKITTDSFTSNKTPNQNKEASTIKLINITDIIENNDIELYKGRNYHNDFLRYIKL